ncbi:hypothetical protein AUP68_15178 [Ilyonectria robusta]
MDADGDSEGSNGGWEDVNDSGDASEAETGEDEAEVSEGQPDNEAAESEQDDDESHTLYKAAHTDNRHIRHAMDNHASYAQENRVDPSLFAAIDGEYETEGPLIVRVKPDQDSFRCKGEVAGETLRSVLLPDSEAEAALVCLTLYQPSDSCRHLSNVMGYSENSGAGDSTGYELRISYPIVVFMSISMYNVIELNVLILATFKKRKGLYFWSFLAATNGIAPHSIGFLLKNILLWDNFMLYITLIAVGWVMMVTGQSLVLYSRLHLILWNEFYRRLVLAMIVTNAIILHVPIIILMYGSNSSHSNPWVHPYMVYEKIQTAYKALVYSIKLKLEFNILNRLLEMSHGNNTSGSLSQGPGTGIATAIEMNTFNGDESGGNITHRAYAHGGEHGGTKRGKVGKRGPDNRIMRSTEIVVHCVERGEDDSESMERKSTGTRESHPRTMEGMGGLSKSSSQVNLATRGFW